jgi:hypothetical protein
MYQDSVLSLHTITIQMHLRWKSQEFIQPYILLMTTQDSSLSNQILGILFPPLAIAKPSKAFNSKSEWSTIA